MKIRFWGTRGSVATPGPGTTHFGGNTSCVEVTTEDGGHLILDCGTGARQLGNELLTAASKPIQGSILLGHTHWDHIQGFPFFKPVFVPGNVFSVWAPQGGSRSLQETLSGQMEFTYFPVELGQLPAQITYHELAEGTYEIGGTRVTTQYLNHPAVTLGYRIEADGADDFGATCAVYDAVKLCEVLQVLQSAHLVVEQGRMGHVADLLADVVKFSGAEDGDLAARRIVKSCESAQQRGFAGSVIAKDGVEFAAGKFGGDAAESGKTAKLLYEVRDGDNGRGGGFSQRDKR